MTSRSSAARARRARTPKIAKASITKIVALGMVTSSWCADASDTTSPKYNFDLRHWKLTLPVDESGGTSGEAMDVAPTQLEGSPGYSSKWFYKGEFGTMAFWAPVDGATTKGSSYARSELRELIDPDDDNVNWTIAQRSVLQAKCKVLRVPANGKLVVGQIHGFQTTPLLKLEYLYDAAAQSGSVVALVNATPDASVPTRFTLASGLALDQAFQYKAAVYPKDGRSVLHMYVDRGPAVDYVISRSWTDVGMYFKAGSYPQDQGSSSEGGKIEFYRLFATHPDHGLGISTKSLPNARADQWYSRRLYSSGGIGAGTWSVVSGRLPAGLSLSSDGVLSGTPEAVSETITEYFSLMVSDQQRDSAARNYALTIAPAN